MTTKDLKRAISDARREMTKIDAAGSDQIRQHGDELLERYAQATRTVSEVHYELHRRAGEERSLRSRVRRSLQDPSDPFLFSGLSIKSAPTSA
jgi:hypothetical protein